MANPKRQRFLDKHEKENKQVCKSDYLLYPKFSFEFNVGNERSGEHSQKDVKCAILSKLLFLSCKNWKEISGLNLKQGFEKIEKKFFKKTPGLPHRFKDVDHIDVFRLPSNKGRLIGFIEEGTFYVVWVDTKFDMYKH